MRRIVSMLIGLMTAAAAQAASVVVCQQSLAGGVSTTLQQDILIGGNSYQTVAPPKIDGYIFTHWSNSVDGAFAPKDVLGRAYDRPSFEASHDMVLTACYVPDSDDKDGDGVRDGCEYYWYGDLRRNGASDTDGDGVNFAQELVDGTNPLMAEGMVSGPIAVATGELVPYAADDCGVLTIRSEPEGVLLTTSQEYCRSGTRMTTVTLSPVTSKFAYWRKNGVVQRDELGRALDCVSFEMGKEDVEVAAVSVDDEVTRQKLYWYGTTEIEMTSDTDGDGMTFEQELANGTNPLMAEGTIAGPITVATGEMVTYSAADCMVVTIRSEPEGELISTTQDYYSEGAIVTTDAFSPSTSKFAYWRKNGVAQRDALGRALDSVSFTTGDGDVEVVAVAVDDEVTRQKLYWYGTTEIALTSDTDGDGVTFEQELANGTNPLMAEGAIAGPIMVSTGAEIVYGSTNVEHRTLYSVHFNANGGVGTMAGQVFTNGVAQALAKNEFTREGYVFAGWGCDKDSAPTWADGEVVSNLADVAGAVVDLWAQWQRTDGGPYTEIVDGITWTYTVSNGEASVGCGSWNTPAVPKTTAGAITIPAALGGFPVTSIGGYAFRWCSGLTSVTIPSSVTSIGKRAFSGCSGLTSMTIPAGVTSIGEGAFEGCSGLTSVTIPSSVTNIGGLAFCGCSGLMSVTILEGVTSIGEYAFWGCSGLTSVTIPASVTSIGDYAFSDCSGLTSVTIPEGVTSIGDWAFYYCSGLTSVTIPASVTSIGEGAFEGCSLDGIALNEGLLSIGYGAFRNNNNLRSVVMPSTIKRLENDIFYSCSKLSSVFFKGNVPEYVDNNFYNGTPNDLITFVRPESTGWKSDGSAELPETWPTSGSYPRKICTWTTYPDVCWLVTLDIGGYELDHCVRDGEILDVSDVECEGYTLIGWDSDLGPITQNETIKAIFTEDGTPQIENVVATVVPAWSRMITIEYDGLAGDTVADKVARLYYLEGDSWILVPASAISGDFTVCNGHHVVSVDADETGLGSGKVIFKIRVAEKGEGGVTVDNEDGIDVENDDGWVLDSTKNYLGVDAWRSRKITYEEDYTSLIATISGVLELEFAWQCPGWGTISCLVDGETVCSYECEETDWQEQVIEFSDEETHVVEWMFESYQSPGTCCYVSLLGVATEVVGETPVTVTIPEPAMELDAEMTEDGLVELVPEFGGATIYYTLDGSVPTVGSAVCDGPVEWSTFRKMQAVAVAADGKWSAVLKGSEYVCIAFEPTLGTTGVTTILRKIGEPIGELPSAERDGVDFLGWCPYNGDDWTIDEDCEVESWWKKLYAVWDVSAEMVIDPNESLDNVEVNDDCYDCYVRQSCSEQGFFNDTNSEWVMTNRVWKEYVRFDAEACLGETNVLMAVEFSGAGTLSFSTLSTYYGDRILYLLDGERCKITGKRLKVLTGGEHRLEIAIAYDGGNNHSDYDDYVWAELSIGGLTWTQAPSVVQVAFEAMGGTLSTSEKQYGTGSTYGSLPNVSHPQGYTFIGWYTAAVGGERIAADECVDFEIAKLYAHWQADLNVALDNNQLNFVSSGASGWFGLSGEAHNGGLAAASGSLTPWTTNMLSTTVSGTGVFSFWWKKSDCFDANGSTLKQEWVDRVLTLEVDGKAFELNQIASADSANGGWSHFALALTNNCLHSVRWTHSFAGDWTASIMLSYLSMDAIEVPGAWIDEVKWEENAELTDVVDWTYSSVQARRNLPGLSGPMLRACTARIDANERDYDARIRRAIVRVKELSENLAFRKLLSRYGFTLADDWSAIFGTFDVETAPGVNDAVDELSAEIMPTLDLALADLDVVPTDWAGVVALSAQEYPVDDDVYVDTVDVTMTRAMLHGAKAALELARGYDMTSDMDKIAEEIDIATNRSAVVIDEFTGDWNDCSICRMNGFGKVGYARVAADGLIIKADIELPESAQGHLDDDQYVLKLRLNPRDNGTYGFVWIIGGGDWTYVSGYVSVDGEWNDVYEEYEVVREFVDGHLYLTIDLSDFAPLSTFAGFQLQEVKWQSGDDEIDLCSDGTEYCPELTCESVIAAHPLVASKIRNAELLQDSREELRIALGLVHDLDRLLRDRSQDQLHFIEYDTGYNEQLGVIADHVSLAITALDEVVTVDGADFAGFGKFRYTNEVHRVTLAPIFEGKVLRSLLPPFEGDLPVLSSIPDITFAGMFPDWTMQDMDSWLRQMNGVWHESPFEPVTEIVDGVEWAYYVRDGKAEIGIGDASSPAIPKDSEGSVEIPETLGGCPVVGIGDFAFFNCGGLTKVVIPAGVTNIGYDAFGYCMSAVDFEGAPPAGLAAACLSRDAVIRYNIAYEELWMSVIAKCGFTNANAYDPNGFTPPDWEPVAKSDTMIIYAEIENVSTGDSVDSDGSLLAAFSADGECRGVAVIEEGPSGMLYQLSVGIESTSESGFVLKVWDASTGEIYEVRQRVDANADKQIGEIFEPVTYKVGELSQSLELNQGWSWISFCLVPEDATVTTLFGGLEFADGDMLKASDRVVSYYGGAWYPATYELKPGEAYMIKKSNGATERVMVTGMPMTDGIAVSSGWNWFGPTTLATQTVTQITHTGGFVDKDVVKGVLKSSTWYDGRWYPSNFELKPGVGYQAKIANAGTLYFGEATAMAKLRNVRANVLSAASKPNWIAVKKSDTMPVFVTVHDLSSDANLIAEGTTIAAFDVNGECRGVAAVEEGPNGKVFQLPIGLESTSETGFVLKIWDAASGTIYEINERIDANDAKQIGQIYAPITCTIYSANNPLPELDNPTTDEVTNVLSKATDEKLAAEITNATEYAAFREWADKVKDQQGETAAGAAGVMASEHAWMSYALGTEKLLEKAPTDADLKVEEFKPTAKDGKFDFTVSVKDVEVGSEASKENLKKIFGLEGSTGLSGFSADKVEIEFGVPENGNVKFTAGPKDTDAKTFFMKVGVKK